MSFPNSIVNIKNIGFMPSLKELSLQGSNIVNLPESIAHLSSLKSLDLSD
jgi:Leucine-rich repeat (LRR) protein